MDLKGVDEVAIFAQHFPIEFERDQHYIHSLNGEDVEPVVEVRPSLYPWLQYEIYLIYGMPDICPIYANTPIHLIFA